MNKYYLITGILLLGAYAAGYFLHGHSISEVLTGRESRLASHQPGQLTNPLLECGESASQLLPGKRASLESEIHDYIDVQIGAGNVADVSMYFRDLNNGPWFGIKEEDQFVPGSLLKLPLAMSYYWRAEKEPQILDQVIEYAGGAPIATENVFGSDTPLPKGDYSVRDLVRIMLTTSSNDAAAVLAQVAGEEQTLQTYKDLNITAPAFGSDYQTSVKVYSAFFRILYNASYPDQEASEELLGYLSQSTFKDGLVAGVPEGVTVAHKFGTRSDTGDEYQLHDCGIVYAPGTPYVLCVMTRGRAPSEMKAVIQGISRLVYEGITE